MASFVLAPFKVRGSLPSKYLVISLVVAPQSDHGWEMDLNMHSELCTQEPCTNSTCFESRDNSLSHHPIPKAAIQRVTISQTSCHHAFHPGQGILAIGIGILGERISLEILILSTPRPSTENVSPLAIGQWVTNNRTPSVVRDRHRHRPSESGSLRPLVVDACAQLEKFFDCCRELLLDRDAVRDHLALCHGDGGVGFVRVGDGGHWDVPAKKLFIGQRDDQLDIVALV